MITVTFIVHNTEGLSKLAAVGYMIIAILMVLYFGTKMLRSIWINKICIQQVDNVYNFLMRSIDQKNPYVISQLMINKDMFQEKLYKCIWSPKKMMSNIFIWNLDQMVEDQKFYNLIYSKGEFENESEDNV